MFLDLLGKQRFVDEEAARWLFDTFGWCIRQFDAGVFYRESILVIPSDEHFPGRADSVQGMAELIFTHVKSYASMAHWPFHVLDQSTCAVAPPARVQIEGPLRGGRATARVPNTSGGIPVPYDADSIRDPEAMIATYAHTLAHYLGQTATEPPPGGIDHWPRATEVLAVFMGFGLMFANSAFNVPVRSCGSCGGPPVQRRSYLTQYESAYALALFCVLKAIPDKQATPHLKKSLRGFYRKCAREIRESGEALARLQAMQAESAPRAPAALALS
jgi:hypothetical protein